MYRSIASSSSSTVKTLSHATGQHTYHYLSVCLSVCLSSPYMHRLHFCLWYSSTIETLSHHYTTCLCLSVCLSVCLPVCLLSPHTASIDLLLLVPLPHYHMLHDKIHITFLSVCLSVIPIYVVSCTSFTIGQYITVCLSVCLFVCLMYTYMYVCTSLMYSRLAKSLTVSSVRRALTVLLQKTHTHHHFLSQVQRESQ